MRRVWLLVAALAAMWVSPARADTPAIRRVSGSLIAPAAAWAFYDQTNAALPSNTVHTAGIAAWTGNRPPEIVALARGLGADERAAGRISADQYVQNVFDYVRNNIAVEFRFGLGKGARGALIDQSGTAFDQADLMVQLVRQGGLSAGYEVGTITVAKDQFGRWTGLVKNLNEASQAFDLDGRAACQLLADGGIPAVFSGGTSCGALAATYTADITLGHAWVVANGKHYDPAFKQHVLHAGLDLPVAMGCGTAAAPTCGANLRSAAIAGAVYDPNTPSVRAMNETGLASTLEAAAQSLETAIEAGRPDAAWEDVVGGRLVDTAFAPTGSATQLANHARQYLWEVGAVTAEVPDRFRTTVDLRYGTTHQLLYADETAGQRMRYRYFLGMYGSITMDFARRGADPLTLLTAFELRDPNYGFLTAQMDHPYAAAGGTYGDALHTLGTVDFYGHLILSLGDAGASTARHYADLDQAAPENANLDTIYAAWGPQSVMAGQYLAQQGQAVRLVEGVAKARVAQHHLIGLVGTNSSLSIEVNASVDPQVADAGAQQAAFGALAMVSAGLEGALIEQTQDSWPIQAPAHGFHYANEKGRTFVELNAANVGTVAPLVHTQTLVNLQGMVNAGFSLIVPTEQPGAYPMAGVLNNTFQVGVAGILAYQADAIAPLEGLYAKGASAPTVADPLNTVVDSLKRVEGTGPPRSAAAVNLATGALTITPPPDLVTGIGAFPFSLAFQRYYSSAANAAENADGFSARSYVGDEPESFEHLGGGWSHGLQITASLGNDALAGLGASRGLDAPRAIAAIQAIRDLHAAPDFLGRITSELAVHWMGQQFLGNAVTLRFPPGAVTFSRMVGGGWRAPPGSPATLVQTGGRSGPSGVLATSEIGFATAMGYNYGGLTLTYTDRDGGVVRFIQRDQKSATDSFTNSRALVASSWRFANGVNLTFDYRNCGNGTAAVTTCRALAGVSSNLGRSLSFQLAATPGGLRLGAVTDDSSRSATFSLACAPDDYGATPSFACGRFTAVNPGGEQSIYDYDLNGGFDDNRVRPGYRMRAWTTASNLASPYLTFAYDEMSRARSVTDARQNASRYLVGGLFSEENRVSQSIDPLNAVSTSVAGRRSSVATDPLGRKTRTEFDDARRVTRTVRPELNASERTYDARSNVLTEVERPKGGGVPQVTTFSYPEPGYRVCVTTSAAACNKPVQVDGPRTDVADVYTVMWDPTWGDLVQVLGPLGLNTRYSYDLFGPAGQQFRQLTTITEALAAGEDRTKRFGYLTTAAGHYALRTGTLDYGGLNLTTTLTFDSKGDVIEVDGPRSVEDTLKYEWDASRRLVLAAEPRGTGTGTSRRPATRYGYTADGQLRLVEKGATALGSSADFETIERAETFFDPVGNKVRQVTYDGASATVVAAIDLSYDASDRLLCSSVRMKLAILGAVGRDACTQADGSTPDRITLNAYDAAGQLTKVTRGYRSGIDVDYVQAGFNPNGTRAWVADGRGNRTGYEYDGFDRLKRLVFPVVAVPEPGAVGASNAADYEEYLYDEANNRTSLRRRGPLRGTQFQTLTYDYDALNRMSVKHVEGDPTHDVFYGYDSTGQMTSARFGSLSGQGTSLTYDHAGRLRSDTTFGRVITSYYDESGNRTALGFSDGFATAYDYDEGGRLWKVRELAPTGTAVLATFAYDALGRRQRVDRENTGRADYHFDGAGRLDSLQQAGGAGQPVSAQTLTYTSASQVQGITQASESYVWRGRPSALPDRTYDGLNRDQTVAVLTGGYDANGNLGSDGVRSYRYDLENRLIRVEPAPNQSGPSLDIAYDPLGRISTTTTNAGTVTGFLYDGDRLVGEYALGGAPLRHYVHGAGVDEPLVWYEGTAKHFLHADRLGTIIAESAAGGQVTPYTYGSWGEPSDWGPLRFRFTGQIALQEAQLYHYKARVYDPMSGRFLQTDPIGQADDPNVYAYAGNDPVNRTDPTGLASDIPCQTGSHISGNSAIGCGSQGGGSDPASTTNRTTSAGPTIQIGRRLTDPFLGMYGRSTHDYELLTPVCVLGEEDCNLTTVNQVVQFTVVPIQLFGSLKPGKYNINLFFNPVVNFSPKTGIFINETLKGHMFHPGRVVEATFIHDGKIYLYTRGGGTGGLTAFNTFMGYVLFAPQHGNVYDILHDRSENIDLVNPNARR